MSRHLTRREFATLMSGAAVGSFGWQSSPYRIGPPASTALAELPKLMEIAGVPGVAACVLQDGKTA